jgi:hypothetical protein
MQYVPLFDFFHILAAADQSATAGLSNHHLVAADIAAIFFASFLYRHVSLLLSLSRTGREIFAFSATRLAGMPAAALSFYNLDDIISKQKVDLPMKRHWR